MENISQMSMLEVACMLMEQKRTPQPIRKIIKEVLEMKGFDDLEGTLATQLYMDITISSKFVYMGNEEWDIKGRQSLDEWDKDGAAFNTKEDLIDEDIDLVLPVDNYDDEDEVNEDEDQDGYAEEEDDVADYEEEEDDDEDEVDDVEETEVEYVDDEIDADYMDEDKYNDYMDNYEDMYDEE